MGTLKIKCALTAVWVALQMLTHLSEWIGDPYCS